MKKVHDSRDYQTYVLRFAWQTRCRSRLWRSAARAIARIVSCFFALIILNPYGVISKVAAANVCCEKVLCVGNDLSTDIGFMLVAKNVVIDNACNNVSREMSSINGFEAFKVTYSDSMGPLFCRPYRGGLSKLSSFAATNDFINQDRCASIRYDVATDAYSESGCCSEVFDSELKRVGPRLVDRHWRVTVSKDPYAILAVDFEGVMQRASVSSKLPVLTVSSQIPLTEIDDEDQGSYYRITGHPLIGFGAEKILWTLLSFFFGICFYILVTKSFDRMMQRREHASDFQGICGIIAGVLCICIVIFILI